MPELSRKVRWTPRWFSVVLIGLLSAVVLVLVLTGEFDIHSREFSAGLPVMVLVVYGERCGFFWNCSFASERRSAGSRWFKAQRRAGGR
jgi:uncharacterized membrane protein YjjP (DUF1212 family)